LGDASKGVLTVILPKVRDPRFVTIRRGGTLTDSDHQLLALWAASCAEHVLDLFESAQPEDPRPRQAIEHARAWVRGQVKMTQARTAAGHAMAGGSVTSSRRRFAGSYLMTSGCGTTSAGQCLTAECAIVPLQWLMAAA
jgi:Imm-5 like putative immunity protein